MSSVLYGRGTYRQGDTYRQRTVTTQRDIGDLSDDIADLRGEMRSLASVVEEMKKALAATVVRLDAIEKAVMPEHSAPTSQ
jgi:hypothetical protein